MAGYLLNLPVMTVIPYDQVKNEIAKHKTRHLLLGNGFSIGCDAVFKYDSLYDVAVKAGLSSRVQALFKKHGTNNFEGIMRLLNDSHWVAKEYGLISGDDSEMLKDKDAIKKALISAVATTHLDDASTILPVKKRSASSFLQYYSNVFTTNYDLLLYWMVMDSGRDTFQDGFRNDPDDASSLIFSDPPGRNQGIFYLHGALHLFYEDGEVKKHSWSKTGKKLTTLVREGLKAERYPLFVAEGDHKKKLDQIQRSSYLGYCLGKISRIEGPLVIYGHSLSFDDHIVERIVRNHKLSTVYIGLRDSEGPSGLALQKIGAEIIQARKDQDIKFPLNIQYFDANSANVWKASKTK